MKQPVFHPGCTLFIIPYVSLHFTTYAWSSKQKCFHALKIYANYIPPSVPYPSLFFFSSIVLIFTHDWYLYHQYTHCNCCSTLKPPLYPIIFCSPLLQITCAVSCSGKNLAVILDSSFSDIPHLINHLENPLSSAASDTFSSPPQLPSGSSYHCLLLWLLQWHPKLSPWWNLWSSTIYCLKAVRIVYINHVTPPNSPVDSHLSVKFSSSDHGLPELHGVHLCCLTTFWPYLLPLSLTHVALAILLS